MKVPVRKAGPDRNEAVAGSRDGGAQEVVLRIPIAKITSMQEVENRLGIAVNEVVSGADAVRFFPIAAASGLSEEVGVVLQDGEELIITVLNVIAGSEESGECAPGINSGRIAIDGFEIVADQSA